MTDRMKIPALFNESKFDLKASFFKIIMQSPSTFVINIHPLTFIHRRSSIVVHPHQCIVFFKSYVLRTYISDTIFFKLYVLRTYISDTIFFKSYVLRTYISDTIFFKSYVLHIYIFDTIFFILYLVLYISTKFWGMGEHHVL